MQDGTRPHTANLVLDLLHEPCDVESLAGKISWWIHVAT
jgi:hypothetical protein